MKGLDRWLTSPPEEQEPPDSCYIEAEEEIEEDDWFCDKVQVLIEDGLCEEDAKRKIRSTDEYNMKVNSRAFEIMENRTEEMSQDIADMQAHDEEF